MKRLTDEQIEKMALEQWPVKEMWVSGGADYDVYLPERRAQIIGMKAARSFYEDSREDGKTGGWISVEDRLPKEGRVYTISQVYPDGDPMRYRILDAQFVKTCKDVTHWMPLPTPPQEKETPTDKREEKPSGELPLRQEFFLY